MVSQNNWQKEVWKPPTYGEPVQSFDPSIPPDPPLSSSEEAEAHQASPHNGEVTGAEGSSIPQGAHAPAGSAPSGASSQSYSAPVQSPVFATAPYGEAMAQPRKSRAWIVALVAVILFFMLMFTGLLSCNAFLNTSFSSMSRLVASSSTPSVTGDTVAIIPLTDTIQYDGSNCSPEGLKSQLDRAADNPDIKAVVLRVDSGGGTATAGEEMGGYVRDFSKPIVVSTASMNASAAYEISSQADYIFTAETSAIGAIGTVMQIADISELLDKLGISIDNITSSESKDSSYGTRELSESERAYYQAMVDQINDVFVATVAEGRDMSVEEVEALANGLTYTGIDAVENGLADEIGTLEDAVAYACELAGIPSANTIYLSSDTGALINIRDLIGMNEYSEYAYDALKDLTSHDNFLE